MTLSLNCKDAGETEEELLANAKKHGIEVHGYTEETWNEDVEKNKEHFRKLIKQS
jgi:post-segregation antitoxin (ccd killing protein)